MTATAKHFLLVHDSSYILKKEKRHKTHRWRQVTTPALSLHPQKYCVPLCRSDLESSTPRRKKLKVSNTA